MYAEFNASAPAANATRDAKWRASADKDLAGKRRASHNAVALCGHFARNVAPPKTFERVPTASTPRRRGAQAPPSPGLGRRQSIGLYCLPARASAARMQPCKPTRSPSWFRIHPCPAIAVFWLLTARPSEWWLTLRSSRAPTAWRASQQALGLRPILRLLSGTPRCRCRLSSNVRHHRAAPAQGHQC